jgi:hypothetical protein
MRTKRLYLLYFKWIPILGFLPAFRKKRYLRTPERIFWYHFTSVMLFLIIDLIWTYSSILKAMQ